jgi:hypothetical protein
VASPDGLVTIKTDSLKEFVTKLYSCQCLCGTVRGNKITLETVVEDNTDILHERPTVMTDDKYVIRGNARLHSLADTISEKLSRPVSIMIIQELKCYVSDQIVAWQHGNEGPAKVTQFRNVSFHPGWWPDEILPWHLISKAFGQHTSQDFSTLTERSNLTMTEFIQEVCWHYLKSFGLDPETHVTQTFTKYMIKRN